MNNCLTKCNLTTICRICLAENQFLKSVFSYEQLSGEHISLCEMLMSISSIMVVKGDGLPEGICSTCYEETNRAFSFRKLCEKSDLALRECVFYQKNDVSVIKETSVPPDISVNNFRTSGRNNTEHYDHTSNTGFIVADENCTENVNHELFIDVEADSFKETVMESSTDAAEESLPSNPYYADQEYISKVKLGKRTPPLDDVITKSIMEKYICKDCEQEYSNLDEYSKHLADEHKNIHNCQQCGKIFKSQKTYAKHMMTDHTENCKIKQTKNGTNVKKKKTGIVKKRNLPRTCEICNKTFRFHSNLERHKLIHTGEKPYLCNVCGKGFTQLTYLKIHSFIHTGEKPYKCQMCDRSFAAPGTLMTHVRIHTGERPHVCKICGKHFPQSGYLTAHIRTHTGEKPVECKVCNRRFNQSGRLIIHMRIHSGEKPYTCNECGRSFAVKGTLNKHIRTHTGERPYVCSVCGQTFAQSGTLATHMKVHRPKCV